MFYLALRQMLAKKGQTSLIFIGIGFGTMIYIIVAGLQLGMRSYMIEQLLNNTAHVLISGKEEFVEEDSVNKRFYSDHVINWLVKPSGKRNEGKINNPHGWFELLDKEPEVLAYAPRYSVQAIASRTNYKTAISLTGIVPAKQIRVSGLESYMKVGSLIDLHAGTNNIILGSNVLKKIGAKIGDTINVTTSQSRSLPFRVVGEIHLGNQNLDDVFSLANIRDVQKLDRTPGRISNISVALENMDASQKMAHRWRLYANDKVESWQEANAQFMEIIKIQDLFRYIITFTILLVSAFGIYNVLSIMISQKQKEIAILRSLGYSSNKILELFFLQGVLLGTAGGIFGLIIGFAACKTIGSIELSMEFGRSRYLWISYDYLIYVVGFAGALASSMIAGLIPAIKASRLTPLEIIRSQS